MWKMKLLLLLVVAVSASCLALRAHTWKHLSPANQHFTVLIPVDAAPSYFNNDDDNFEFETKRATYTVRVIEIGHPDGVDAEQVMQLMIDFRKKVYVMMAVAQTERTLVSDQRVTSNGYSGREVKFDDEWGAEVIRLLIVGKRLYVLSVDGDRDDRQFNQNTAKFLSSFEVR